MPPQRRPAIFRTTCRRCARISPGSPNRSAISSPARQRGMAARRSSVDGVMPMRKTKAATRPAPCATFRQLRRSDRRVAAEPSLYDARDRRRLGFLFGATWRRVSESRNMSGDLTHAQKHHSRITLSIQARTAHEHSAVAWMAVMALAADGFRLSLRRRLRLAVAALRHVAAGLAMAGDFHSHRRHRRHYCVACPRASVRASAPFWRARPAHTRRHGCSIREFSVPRFRPAAAAGWISGIVPVALFGFWRCNGRAKSRDHGKRAA